jgi:catabolite regulation protein CreA
MPDVKRNALIYLAVSSKIIEGSPANAISVVLIMPGQQNDRALLPPLSLRIMFRGREKPAQ